MPTLSSLAAPQVVVMTTCGAASDDKVGIMIVLGFNYDHQAITRQQWLKNSKSLSRTFETFETYDTWRCLTTLCRSRMTVHQGSATDPKFQQRSIRFEISAVKMKISSEMLKLREASNCTIVIPSFGPLCALGKYSTFHQICTVFSCFISFIAVNYTYDLYTQICHWC